MLNNLPSGSETILVVDDDDTVRALIRETLKVKGYTVLDARFNSGALLVAGRHHGPIHLLIADLIMPGINGRELARRLEALRPNMKRLYISGYPKEAVFSEKLLEEGAAFLEKPLGPETLLPKVRELLDPAPSVVEPAVADHGSADDFVIETLSTLLDQPERFELSDEQTTKIHDVKIEYETHRVGCEADFLVAELHVQTLIQDGTSTLLDIEMALMKSEHAQTFLRLEGVKALRAAEALLTGEQREKLIAYYPHGRRRGPDRLRADKLKTSRRASP